MARRGLGVDVFQEGVDRMVRLYEAGHRVIVTFSAGKDSGINVELAIIAATLTDRLPVEVIMRDEEIDLPGTYEYAARVAARPEVDFHWVYANQPVINIYNREAPYFWTFDPELAPDDWVRKPPEFARYIDRNDIQALTDPADFPPPEGKNLINVTGLRVSESAFRLLGLHSSGGYTTKPDSRGVIDARPIYDWRDGDVWRAIAENGWDYNKAYDTLFRMGLPAAELRIAPPTQTPHALTRLVAGAKAWPRWFDRVAARLPGVRNAVLFGMKSITAERRLGESWEATFRRECIENAPGWIAERNQQVLDHYEPLHARHSTQPIPEMKPCPHCGPAVAWRKMTQHLYNGDPFAAKYAGIKVVEPEFFREGAGTWGGSPSW